MYASAISKEIDFKYTVYNFTKPVLPSNVTSGVHYNTQLLPPDNLQHLLQGTKHLHPSPLPVSYFCTSTTVE